MRTFLAVLAYLFCLPLPGLAEETCSPAQRLSVDLDAWAQALRKERTPGSLDKALAKIGLPSSTEGDGADMLACDGRRLVKLHVDMFKAQVSDVGEARVVQVLARLCPGDDATWQLQRAAAFLPLGKHDWCRVETPFLNQSGSSWGPQLCAPALFAFEKLTTENHVTLKLINQQEWCGGAGIYRGGETKVTWWELRAGTFVPILSVTTDRSYYRSPLPPIETFSTKVKITGAGYPKVVELVEKTTCDDPGEDALKEDDSARNEFANCKEKTIRKSCIFRDGRYVCAGRK